MCCEHQSLINDIKANAKPVCESEFVYFPNLTRKGCCSCLSAYILTCLCHPTSILMCAVGVTHSDINPEAGSQIKSYTFLMWVEDASAYVWGWCLVRACRVSAVAQWGKGTFQFLGKALSLY